MKRTLLRSFGLVAWFFGAPTSHAFDCQRIQGREGGDRIRIVVYAEAYTEPMKDWFDKEVREGVADMFSLSPWREYKDHFVVYSVWTPSAWDYLGNNPSDSTYFHSTFDGKYSHLPYAGVTERVDADSSFRCKELSAQALKQSYSVVVVNLPSSMLVTGIYPGNATVLVSRYGLGGVMGHELGHAIAGLSDEYSGTGSGGTPFFDGNPVYRPVYNIAASTDPDKVPWKAWISDSTPLPTPATAEYDTTVGLFLGADYSTQDRYKPTQHCMMRGVSWMDALPALCVVCREAFTYRILSVFQEPTNPWNPRPRIALDSVWPPTGSNLESGRVLVRPFLADTLPLKVRWMFDRRAISVTGDNLDVAGLVGAGNLEAVIVGESPFIRTPRYLVHDTLRWTVRKASSVSQSGRFHDGIRRTGPAMFVVPIGATLPQWARSANGRRVPLRVVSRTADGWLVRGVSDFGEVLFLAPSVSMTESAGGMR